MRAARRNSQIASQLAAAAAAFAAAGAAAHVHSDSDSDSDSDSGSSKSSPSPAMQGKGDDKQAGSVQDMMTRLASGTWEGGAGAGSTSEPPSQPSPAATVGMPAAVRIPHAHRRSSGPEMVPVPTLPPYTPLEVTRPSDEPQRDELRKEVLSQVVSHRTAGKYSPEVVMVGQLASTPTPGDIASPDGRAPPTLSGAAYVFVVAALPLCVCVCVCVCAVCAVCAVCVLCA